MNKSSRKRLNKSLIFPTLGAALSALMNAKLGWDWDPYAIGGAGMALGVLLIDGVKPTLAPAIARDLRHRSFGSALFKTLMLSLLVTISAFAAFSFVSAVAEKKTGPAKSHDIEWMGLKQQKENMLESLDKMDLVRSIPEINADISTIKGTVVKTRRGTFTAGYLMECAKVGTTDFGPVSQKYCPLVERKKLELTKSINKAKVEAVIARISDKMEKLGAPVEVDPGAARAASIIGMDKGDVRTVILSLIALAIELIATFGQLLGKSTAPRPATTPTRPKTVHDWLIANADNNGTVEASYDDIKRALNMSKSTAWRHAKKLIDAGIINYDNGQFALA